MGLSYGCLLLFGNNFNPIIATLITSASRLILVITEAILSKHNSTYAFCDTDSMAVPPEHIKEIQGYFQKLNPYKIKDLNMFKIEKDDCGKPLHNVWFYGISTKRYVLYDLIDGKPHLRKYSSHCLGHLLNPFNADEKDWHKQFWEDILNEHYGLISSEELYEKYSHFYAISRLTLSSPELMKRIELINEGKPYDKQIKPFNFILVGMGNKKETEEGKIVKPIAPFRKDFHKVVYEDFVDYNSGKILNGIEYWKPLDWIYWEYKNHPESKFEGNVGILQRKHLVVKNITHIGKESSNLDETEIIGVQDDSYQKYFTPGNLRMYEEDLRKTILNLRPKTAKKHGISKRELMYLRRKVKDNKPLRLTRKIRERLDRIIRWQNKI